MGRVNSSHYPEVEVNTVIINESVMLLAVGLAIVSALLGTMPRCPECGCCRTVRDSADRGLLHCRRCQTVFQPGERR